MKRAAEATPHLPLRARKKAKTRRALIEAAQRRFLKDGFAATTLEAICSDVDVHVRTAIRHFGTKEELALAAEYERFEELARELRHPGREPSVLDTWRAYLAEIAGQLRGDAELARHARFVAKEPALAAMEADLLNKFEDLLASELAREVGGGRRQELRARLLAAMLVGGMRAAARSWMTSRRETNLRRAFVEVVDEAQDTFPEWRRLRPARTRR